MEDNQTIATLESDTTEVLDDDCADCPDCGGWGVIYVWSAETHEWEVDHECPICNGTGDR